MGTDIDVCHAFIHEEDMISRKDKKWECLHEELSPT